MLLGDVAAGFVAGDGVDGGLRGGCRRFRYVRFLGLLPGAVGLLLGFEGVGVGLLAEVGACPVFFPVAAVVFVFPSFVVMFECGLTGEGGSDVHFLVVGGLGVGVAPLGHFDGYLLFDFGAGVCKDAFTVNCVHV